MIFTWIGYALYAAVALVVYRQVYRWMVRSHRVEYPDLGVDAGYRATYTYLAALVGLFWLPALVLFVVYALVLRPLRPREDSL